MHSSNLSLQNQARAAAIHARNSVNMADARNKATATKTARFVDKLSPRTKTILQRNLNFGIRPESVGNKALRGSLKVGSKLPGVGFLIAGAGVGYDVSQGKDATTSVASNFGGYLAGAGASAAVLAAGGPVGWAVGIGAVASVGVGFAVDEWGDDVANWAGDTASAVGDWASDLF